MMTRSVGGVITAGLVAVLAGGCANNESTAGSSATKPGQETQQVIALRGELVYTRIGGFMGTNDRVAIQPDGRLDASGKRLGPHAGQLAAAQLAELAGPLQNWPRMEVRGQPPRGAADYFELSITYAGKTVAWTSLTPDVPAELTRLASRIEELARSVK